MNIDDYVPENFDPEKFHALKCLWLHNRKATLFMDMVRNIQIGDVEAFKKANPYISASEQLQRETGMSLEDISYFSNIGSYVYEYSQMLQMNEYQLSEHINQYESDPPDLDDEDKLDLEELWDDISNKIREKNEMREQFGQIINVNFNNKEKPTDS